MGEVSTQNVLFALQNTILANATTEKDEPNTAANVNVDKLEPHMEINTNVAQKSERTFL